VSNRPRPGLLDKPPMRRKAKVEVELDTATGELILPEPEPRAQAAIDVKAEPLRLYMARWASD
jgi:hypothetical protein